MLSLNSHSMAHSDTDSVTNNVIDNNTNCKHRKSDPVFQPIVTREWLVANLIVVGFPGLTFLGG